MLRSANRACADVAIHPLCRADRSYVITGGLGGFGLALAVWLANRGARAFVLTSKRGLRTGGQRKVIELLRSRGCKVRGHCPTVVVAMHCVCAGML